MASKGYTPAELKSLLKTQLELIAKQLGIDPAGMLKQVIADRILEVAPLVGDTDTAPGGDVKSETEGSVTSVRSALLRSPITTPPIVTPTSVTSRGSKLKGSTFDFSQAPKLFLNCASWNLLPSKINVQSKHSSERSRRRKGISIGGTWNCWTVNNPSR